MLIELIIALVIGIIAGTFTGLSPGIHINLVAAILIASLAYFTQVPLIFLAVFIVSMSITHTFIDFIPSIFLGAPEEDSFLSLLPGHQLLLEGRGYEAFILTLYGSIFAIPIILLFTPIFIFILPTLYELIKTIMPFLLIFLSLYIILREDNFILSSAIFILAGFLGLFTFNLPVKEPLLPLLSGLFGLSGLITSLKSKTIPKKQSIVPLKKIKLEKKQFLKYGLASAIFSPLCSFLPGIGSSHAATLGSEFIKPDKRGFLFLVGSANTIIMGLSYVAVYTINKSRTGTAAAVKEILKNISSSDMMIILIAILISGIISFFLAIFISKIFAKFLNKINYYALTGVVIVILSLINIIFTNWLGLLVLITSASLGTFTILSKSRRINLMAALILPAIVYYLIN
ncbi:MAG: tripartite tricarboxylate transporter permease [Nanoarchaeota archaeon]